MNLQDSKYIIGFNYGYILAQFEPKLLSSILNGLKLPSSPFIEGLLCGQKEFILFRESEQLKDLGKLRINPRENNDLEKD